MSTRDLSSNSAIIAAPHGSAHGKVILAGEHATVYGHAAVAVGLERGVHARASRMDGDHSVLAIGKHIVRDCDDGDLARAFREVIEPLPPFALPVRIDVESNVPAGSGLGSSAAIGVAVIRALDPRAGQAEVLRRAMQWESVFHGNPSGLDALIAARGGCVLFERGKRPIGISVPRAAFLCIGHSGTTASTRMMVDSVAKLRAASPEGADVTLTAIGAIARHLARALREGDLHEVGRLMRANHGLLRDLGVSTPAIDRMCDLARDAGALGAKLTGSGGGGCVVALCDARLAANAVQLAWKRDGFEAFSTRLCPPQALAA